MKKIGFIDYYLDEWHADNYPAMIRNGAFGKRMDVALAWEEIHPEDRMNIDQWCAEYKVAKASSIEQVVEECDYIIVLSPDNAERHEDLSDLPLKSGKPVYIDKPIAPSLESAERIYAKAAKYNTPLMSSSALRFGSKLQNAMKNEFASERPTFVSTLGDGLFHIYAIHQIEMIVVTLGTGAMRVMQIGNEHSKAMVIDYGDHRRAVIDLLPGQPFELRATYGGGKLHTITNMDDIFPKFVDAMLNFFETEVSPVPVAETLEVAALIEAGTKAFETPDIWVPVPKVSI